MESQITCSRPRAPVKDQCGSSKLFSETASMVPSTGRMDFRICLRQKRGLSLLGVSAMLMLAVIWTHSSQMEAVVLRGDQSARSIIRPMVADSGLAVHPAFVDSTEGGETWYAIRTNKAPRLLRVTAAPDEKASDRGRWYKVLFNFKPLILKLSPDAASLSHGVLSGAPFS
ncbi:hypothetical protein Efla_007094 [Eimeria flavescens]